MPKIIHILVVITLLAALGIVLGCGTGDKGTVGRVSPTDLVSGISGTDNGTGGGPGPIGGGGGGGNGACVFAKIQCVNNLTASACSGGGGVLNTGTTCQNLGYTNCQTIQGYQVCN